MAARRPAKGLFKAWLGFLFSFFFLLSSWKAHGKELVDYTLAVVESQVLTARASALDYVFGVSSVEGIETLAQLASDRSLLEAHMDRFIRREMVRQYTNQEGRYSSELSKDVDNLREEIALKWGSKEDFETFLASSQISESEVRETLERYIYEARFLEEELGTGIRLSDEDTRAYYEKNREKLFLNQLFEKVQVVVKTKLLQRELSTKFENWYQNEKKRIRFVLLPKPEEPQFLPNDTSSGP